LALILAHCASPVKDAISPARRRRWVRRTAFETAKKQIEAVQKAAPTLKPAFYDLTLFGYRALQWLPESIDVPVL